MTKKTKKKSLNKKEIETFWSSVKRGEILALEPEYLYKGKWANRDIKKIVKKSAKLQKKLRKLDSKAYSFCAKHLGFDNPSE